MPFDDRARVVTRETSRSSTTCRVARDVRPSRARVVHRFDDRESDVASTDAKRAKARA